MAHKRSHAPLIALFGVTAGIALGMNACSPPSDATGDTGSGFGGSGNGGHHAGSGGATATSTGTAGSGGGTDITTTADTDAGTCVVKDPKVDQDGDGYSQADGDCNDCDPNVNPGAVDALEEVDGGPGVVTDNDCSGKAELPKPCDDALAMDSADPMDGAKAIGGLCAKWVKTAKWVQADGSPPPADAQQLAAFHLGHGILPDFGASNPPLEGKRLLVLSSGTARRAGDPGFVHRNFDKGYVGGAPFGFPKESPSCQGVTTKEPHDAAGLELEIQAPTNAQGFSFDFNFFTYEWPQYICTEFNDFFIANMSPFPKGQKDGNISFDALGNPISVNNAFLDICGCPGNPPGKCSVPPDKPTKQFDCALGAKGLAGTDFASDDSNQGFTNGSSGWLETSAPVEKGQKFVLRFVTYDSSDGNVDSTTIIDNFKWSAQPGQVVTVRDAGPPPK
jgi:hypothetical protein